MNMPSARNRWSWHTLLLVGAALTTATILFMQAYHVRWVPHLQSDVIIHFYQALHFQQTGSWSGVTVNEYQPGALWFFMVPAALGSFQENFDIYRSATFFLNGLLLVLHIIFFWLWGPKHSPWIFLFITLASGPILLYRFELAVSLLVLVSWWLFSRRHVPLAVLLLGLATATKLYPIILLPFLIGAAVRQRHWRLVRSIVLFFGLGLALPTLPYVAAASWGDLRDSFSHQTIKPVGLDSLWGSGLGVYYQQVLQQRPVLDAGHGIHGIAPEAALRPLSFFNYFWIVPTGLVITLLLVLYRGRSLADPLIPLIVIMTFLLSAKVINPQYVWWFFSWLPLLPLKDYSWFWRGSVLVLTGTALVLTQLVYPLYYDDFLNYFYGRSAATLFFNLSVLRNLCLTALFFFFVGGLFARSNAVAGKLHRSAVIR